MGTLRITTSVVNNMWQLEFAMEGTLDFPGDIFLYENTGTGLGPYFGVCSLSDYRKFQTYVNGVDIPVFGNKFIKHTIGVLTFAITEDPLVVKEKVIKDVKAFKAAYNAGQFSTTSTVI